MSDPIEIDVVVEIGGKLEKAIDSSPKSLVPQLESAFKEFHSQAAKWMKDARKIVVTDASQKADMKRAAESRKELKKIRCAAEEKRKELKADALLYGRAIDAVAGVITDGLKPIEEYLQLQEDFVEIQELKRKSALIESRGKQMAAIGTNPAMYQLGEMTEEAFGDLLVGLKVAKEQAAERARLLDEQRAAERKKIEEQAAENARIRQEAAHVQKVAAEAQHLLLSRERLMVKTQADNVALKAELEATRAKIQTSSIARPRVAPSASLTPAESDLRIISQYMDSLLEVPFPEGLRTDFGNRIAGFIEDSINKMESEVIKMKKGIK